jgi:hypothetical protein
MATYSVYLKHDAESELVSSAKKLGISPIDLIRNRITQGAITNQTKAANRKLDTMFSILEMMLRESSFVSGVIRTAYQPNDKLFGAGMEHEKRFSDAMKQYRNQLEKEGISTQF